VGVKLAELTRHQRTSSGATHTSGKRAEGPYENNMEPTRVASEDTPSLGRSGRMETFDALGILYE